MREETNFNFEGIAKRPDKYTWQDAMRHRNAVKLLARQLAFRETGEQASAIEVGIHLKIHLTRLILDAEKLIATSSSFEDWRFPRSD